MVVGIFYFKSVCDKIYCSEAHGSIYSVKDTMIEITNNK